MRLFLIISSVYLVVGSAFAGDPKGDFVQAVVSQCKKSADEAAKLATPGRTGTVAQFQLCSSPTVDVGDGCKIACTKSGSSIGD